MDTSVKHTKLGGIRGSGVKHTLPFLGRFAGLWLAVSVGAVVVASVSTYLVMGAAAEATTGSQQLVLIGQTLFLILALVGLAVFTTHRLAGPWIAIRRALRDVRDGDLDRRLKIRTADRHLKEVEHEFNAMMESLRGKVGGPG